MSLKEDIEKAPINGTIAKIREELDRKENLPKETGDITLTGEPPEEPLTDPLESVDDPLDRLVDAIQPLVMATTCPLDMHTVTARLQAARHHSRQKDKTITNLQETIHAIRADVTKIRKDSDSAIEGPLAQPLDCIIDRIDLMLDPTSTPTAVANAAREAKVLCRELIHLARLSILVEESNAVMATCSEPQPTPTEPQAQAMTAALDATERAMPVPADADASRKETP